MASTYTPIYSTTLGSSQASVTLNSFSGYTDLILVINAFDNASTNVYCQVGNGSIDTTSNYSHTILAGNGTTAYSYRESNQSAWIYAFEGTPQTTNGAYILQFNNYSNSTTYKTMLSRANSSTGVDAIVGTWRSTSPITTIKLSCQSSTVYSAGSTFTLYGIKAA